MVSDKYSDLPARLSSWRQVAGITEPPPESPGTGWLVEAHHRQQLQHAFRLCMESLAAYKAFASAVLDYVANGKDTRSPELQQRVTDYGAGVLQAYEVTSARASQAAISNILDGLPREVIRTVYRDLPPAR
jgi:hypothetical protein